MNKLLTSAIALAAILTLEMNQPVEAHGGHGGGHGGGHYGGGHYGGHYGGYHHGYGRGYGRGYGYGLGAVGVGIGLGGLGVGLYDNNAYYGAPYGGSTCGYDSFGNYYCTNY